MGQDNLGMFFTENSGYFGKLFSKSKQHQIGFITRKKRLRKKSPTRHCTTVNTVSITVNLTSSCPNIVSQHNLRSLSFSLRSLLYLFSVVWQFSNIAVKTSGGSSPGDEVPLDLNLKSAPNRRQIVFVQPRSS